MSADRHSKSTVLSFIGMLFLLQVLMTCVPQDVAGTSSEVDNPSLEIGFVEKGEERRVTGSLGIFKSKQNPFSHPEPRQLLTVNNSNTVTLPATALLQLAKDSSGPGSSDELHFNLVFKMGNNLGGVLYNLAFLKNRRQFVFANDTGITRVHFSLQAPLDLYDTLPSAWDTLNAGYLYIPGTPFRTVIQDNILILNGIPSQTFTFVLMNKTGEIYHGQFTSQNKFDTNLVPDRANVFHFTDFKPIMDCSQENQKLNSDDIIWLEYQRLSHAMFMECPDFVCTNLLDRLQSGRTFEENTKPFLRIQFLSFCPPQRDSVCTDIKAALDSSPDSTTQSDSLHQMTEIYRCQDFSYFEMPSGGSGDLKTYFYRPLRWR